MPDLSKPSKDPFYLPTTTAAPAEGRAEHRSIMNQKRSFKKTQPSQINNESLQHKLHKHSWWLYEELLYSNEESAADNAVRLGVFLRRATQTDRLGNRLISLSFILL